MILSDLCGHALAVFIAGVALGFCLFPIVIVAIAELVAHQDDWSRRR